MRIHFVDAANPVGVPSLREVWNGGPAGFYEPSIIAAVALKELGHLPIFYGQTARPKMEQGIEIRPLPWYEEAQADGTIFFIGQSARAPWAPYQEPDATIVDIMRSIKGPVLALSGKPLVPKPTRWFTSMWRYLAYSQWHSNYLVEEGVPAGAVRIVGLPMHPDNQLDEEMAAKRPLLPRVLFASSPDRGLADLLSMWPAVREKMPEAELYVTYTTVNNRPQDREEKLEWQRQGVYFVGNLSFHKMKELFHQTHVLAYPATEDVETFCYTAYKAQMAGCVPVVTPKGALPEAIMEGGGYVTRPTSFLNTLSALLLFKNLWEVRSRVCKTIQTQSPLEFASRLLQVMETV